MEITEAKLKDILDEQRKEFWYETHLVFESFRKSFNEQLQGIIDQQQNIISSLKGLMADMQVIKAGLKDAKTP